MTKPHLVLLHAPSVYDFRKEAILYGPISDLVPSTPIFEMYPIGFTTLAEYLERHGFRTRIVNLAVRMLRDRDFDAEAFIASLDPLAFGIDLHWLPHAQGALEVAKIVKRHHPQTPVIMGGFSASYYHQELVTRQEVDYVLRGDSTEGPLLQLMKALVSRGPLDSVANLTWRDERGRLKVNPFTYLPPDLSDVALDYSHLVKAVVRDRDLASNIPFFNWLEYPIMASLSCRGCTQGCVTCGGSAYASRHLFGREKPAYRTPEMLAQDIKDIKRFSRGPVFLLGDLRQAGIDYAQELLSSLRGVEGEAIVELFAPASQEYLEEVVSSFPRLCLEFSLESHDPKVRRAFGKGYSSLQDPGGNEEVEATIRHALEAGCQRLDIFFMIGLPQQTPQSVMETIDYCGALLERFGGDGRLHPYISPLAPFLDPGSQAFEQPRKYGYRLFYRTLEEHRRALLSPSWKCILNYETRWMKRGEIVETTYEAQLRLSRLKAAYGLISDEERLATEERISKAKELIGRIDRLLEIEDEVQRKGELQALKPQMDEVNFATLHEDRELALPVGWGRWNPFWAVWLLAQEWWDNLKGGRRAPS
ncbi:MAG TPA: TIGR04190 family B12-binding domain/radical SAM domain protein [Chloroflexi bacterium]|nr:TIGR04190 family B12-binding domain/radical SAM domain protein [Chloroflexota bacterium]